MIDRFADDNADPRTAQIMDMLGNPETDAMETVAAIQKLFPASAATLVTPPDEDYSPLNRITPPKIP